ncbi:hypothetical protein MSAN_01176500 [Mycena sanguinolenta]|uniref:Pre-mRNA-processing factor 19 n=1 Tax=Mycena sanguinolenta TaxID=230812 RepID=A0A8H7D426_9AGAR|nr:hypothetical protein MSAN_01176500 [Mycena sanguinolenta]
MFLCAISGQPPQDPVVSNSGHVYERRLILAHIAQRHTDPITGEKLDESDLIAVKASPHSPALPPPQPERPTTLPQFSWNLSYESLRRTLWPDSAAFAEGQSLRNEPPALRSRIESSIPDAGWLTHRHENSDSNATDVDESDSDGEGEDPNDVDQRPAGIRYINLHAHPELAIDGLGREVDRHHNKATFAVRDEYDSFIQHAISRIEHPPDDSYCARFFVTGKTFGCYYFLFRLLASGQSVFFIKSPRLVYHFSSGGVQKATEMPEENDPATIDALRASWVLVDTDDDNSHWVPPKLFNRARCVVWTSSARESRMNEFSQRFGAETWYMKAWSAAEIAAVTGEGVQPVYRVFLIQPLLVVDEESGEASLQRTDYAQLASALDTVAGKLLEGMMHRALTPSNRVRPWYRAGTAKPEAASPAKPKPTQPTSPPRSHSVRYTSDQWQNLPTLPPVQ